MGKRVLIASILDWDSPFQVGSHHIANQFLKHGWDVCFVSEALSPFHFIKRNESIDRRLDIVKSNGATLLNGKLFLHIPFSLLVPRNYPILNTNYISNNWHKFIINNFIQSIKKNGFSKVDILYFDNINFSFLLNEIQHDYSILRIADNNSGFNNFNNSSNRLESQLIRNVDLTIYSAKNLKKYVQDKNPKKSAFIPNGINLDNFKRNNYSMPTELKFLSGKIVIYVGAIDYWMDFDLINYAATQLPELNFIFIGPDDVAKKKFLKLDNIKLLGRKNYLEIPNYLYYADIGIIPFNLKDYPVLVNSINPLKLYEYMACGLNILSACWDELVEINAPICYYKDKDEFVEQLQLLSNKNSGKRDYMDFLNNKDWENSFKKILSTLGVEL